MNPIGYVSRLRKLAAMRVRKEWAKPLDVDLFRDQGVALVKGVFSSDEMQGIRERVGQAYEQGLQNQDLLSNPLMSEVLLDSRIVGIAEAVLGGRPTYYGDGSISKRPYSTPLHRDSIDRLDPKGPEWTDDFGIVKFGIYLDDCADRSGGMILQRASHRVFISPGAAPHHSMPAIHSYFYLNSQLGDVLVWDLRAVHAGGVLMARGLRQPIDPRIVGMVPRWAKVGLSPNRSAIFFSMGIQNAALDRYMTYLKTRTRECNRMQRSFYGAPTLEKAGPGWSQRLQPPRGDSRRRQAAQNAHRPPSRSCAAGLRGRLSGR